MARRSVSSSPGAESEVLTSQSARFVMKSQHPLSTKSVNPPGERGARATRRRPFRKPDADSTIVLTLASVAAFGRILVTSSA